MPTMDDYLDWRGDLGFDERPLNEVDNLILSTIAYLDLGGIVPGPGAGSVGLGAALGELLRRAGGDLAPYVRSIARIEAPTVERIARSRRFSHLAAHDYVARSDSARSLQFAALQVDVGPDETYVAYRGTDGSLDGWRENFMISYEVTEAQRMAASYLVRALAPGRRLFVGGHSKGGNLAAYAVAARPAGLLGRIERAFSNDGPGLPREVVPKGPREVLGERFVRIQPAYSVVGQIFDRVGEPRTYVRSTAFGVLQHDPTTWEVMGDGFVRAGGLEAEAAASDEALNRWIQARDLQTRESVTKELFDVLGAGGAQELDEIAASPQGIQRVLVSMGSMDEETKEVMRELMNGMFASTMAARRENATQAAAAVVRAARTTLGSYLRPRIPSETEETTEITSEATSAEPNEASTTPDPKSPSAR